MPTIGVSIAVPDPCGAQLQEYRVGLGDESARLIPTHVTLLPPYELAEGDLADVTEHLGTVAEKFDPFAVHMRGTGTFRPVSPVVFVNVVKGISRCEQLAQAVRRGPFDLTAAFPYHPHVTVAHHLEDPLMDQAFDELADFECVFPVDRIWMYVHDHDHGWQPTESFALNDAAPI